MEKVEKIRIIMGVVVIILGLLLAAGPQTIFPVCGIREQAHSGMTMDNDSMGDVQSSASAPKMKCFWTGRAEIGTGGVIAIIGLFLLIFKDKRIRMGLSLALFPVGIYALLIPNALIGVCSNVHMVCRALTLPAVTIIGAAISVIAVVNIVLLLKTGKEGNGNGA